MSGNNSNESDTNSNESDNQDFLFPGTICAIAADNSSHDVVRFLQIIGISSSENIIDDYDHMITPGQEYLEGGHYLEKNREISKGYYFDVIKSKKVFCYKECILYPFVPFTLSKDKMYLPKRDYVDMTYYLEQTGLSSIL